MRVRRRYVAILAAGVVLVVAALFYREYFLARPIGSGPAGPAVDGEAFESVWTERPIKIVGIGDSVTAGLGAASPAHSYFMRLIRNPPDEHADMRGKCLSRALPNLEYQNLAVSGSESSHHVATVEEKLDPHSPEVFGLIVLTTGGNDLIHSYGMRPPRDGAMYGATLEQSQPWIEAFRSRLDGILDRIDECFPGGCEIYLADIYDPTDGSGDAPSIYLPHWEDGLAIHSKYNATIAACAAARDNVHGVPMHRTFLGHGSKCRQFWRESYAKDDPHYWYYDNVEDPNDRGYDAIRRVFLNTILAHSKLSPRRNGQSQE